MKTASILTTAVLVGAGIIALTYGNIARSAGPLTLQCEITDTTRYYGSYHRADNAPDVKRYVWTLALKGDTWTLISVDGHVLADEAKNDKDNWGKSLPLRTTATSYFLAEENRRKTDETLETYNGPLAIERATGTLTSSSGLIYTSKPGAAYDSSGSEATETTGHCAPVSITAKF